MASTLLSTILCLNLVASVSYLVFRALAFAGRKHISEKWRYNCITIIMCLYVIPFYKLLPDFRKPLPTFNQYQLSEKILYLERM